MTLIYHLGFQRMWGQDSVDLLQNRHILPGEEIKPPKPKLQENIHQSLKERKKDGIFPIFEQFFCVF